MKNIELATGVAHKIPADLKEILTSNPDVLIAEKVPKSGSKNNNQSINT